MMPRLFDERVGYFTTSTMDYSRDEHRADARRYIARWRLEKKDPTAAVSEPVKPIVYYIDPATPMKWVPWLKKGIEDWQLAFEAAGFKNAIIAKEAPTPEEDPDWSPEDVRNSVVRWLPSTIENASGPHISDPRTGEILNADIQFYHNVMNLAARLVFRAGGSARSARPEAAAARRSDGPPARVRGGARGRPHAGLPAQHESQLDVPAGESSRPGMGPEDGPHAFDHGLFALQLRRAAGGQNRSRRSDPAHRSIRQLGRRTGATRRSPAPRHPTTRRRLWISGRASRTNAVAALLHHGSRRSIPARRPRRSATPTPVNPPRSASRISQRVAKMLMPATAERPASRTKTWRNCTAACSASGPRK